MDDLQGLHWLTRLMAASDSVDGEAVPEIRMLSHEVDLKSLISDAIDMSPVAMIVADRSGIVRGWNRAAEEIFGWSKEEALGKKTPFVAEDSKEHSAAFKKRIWAGEVVSNRHHIRNHKSGAKLDVKISACPIKSRSGDIIGSFGIVQDITEDMQKHRNLELSIMALQHEIDTHHRKKVNFLSYLSHEMRTPLTAIQGQIDQFRLVRRQMLSASGLPLGAKLHTNSPFEKLMTDIREHTEHLHALIGEAISFSKFDADHRFDLKVQKIDLDRLEHALQTSFPQILAKQKTKFDIQKSDVEIYNDQKMLKQILYNLVYNAIKFTEGGRISLETDISADGNLVLLRVCDTGVGIAVEDQAKIFEAFEKGSHRPKLSEGSGLGLALSRSMAREMGGDLILEESTQGVGSTFLLSIRRDLRTDASKDLGVPKETTDRTGDLAVMLAQKPLAGLKVLVAEDAEVIRGLFVAVLSSAGAEVVAAEDGQQCIKLWESHKPDLVLLDIKMPVMDGWTAIRHIRAVDESLPVIAVTASVLGQELKKSYRAGFTEVVSKPVDWTELVKLMVRLRHQKTVSS